MDGSRSADGDRTIDPLSASTTLGVAAACCIAI
jgi:hypothetical protein